MSTSPESTSGESSASEPEYHLVVIPDSGEAAASVHATLEDLVAAYAMLRENSAQLFVFRGARLMTSKGGTHLSTHGGWIPLDIPPKPELEIDPLGRSWASPLPPPKAGPPQPPAGQGPGDFDFDADAEDDDDLPELPD